MSAEILAFPSDVTGKSRKTPGSSRKRKWLDRHLPLIDAAMDLHRAGETEFRRRCRIIAETEGRPVLKKLADQLDRLGAHVAGISSVLPMTAQRIRKAMAEGFGT